MLFRRCFSFIFEHSPACFGCLVFFFTANLVRRCKDLELDKREMSMLIAQNFSEVIIFSPQIARVRESNVKPGLRPKNTEFVQQCNACHDFTMPCAHCKSDGYVLTMTETTGTPSTQHSTAFSAGEEAVGARRRGRGGSSSRSGGGG
jgi:hypothetical protein